MVFRDEYNDSSEQKAQMFWEYDDLLRVECHNKNSESDLHAADYFWLGRKSRDTRKIT